MADKKKQKKSVPKELSKLELKFDGLIGLFEHTQTAMQAQAAHSLDISLVVRNWLFGWYIVEFEQNGFDRASYGSRFIANLAERLKPLNIKGTSETRLKLYRSFYQNFQTSPALSDQLKVSIQISPTASDLFNSDKPGLNLLTSANLNIDKIWQTLSAQFHLSWSHYVVLLTIKSEDERRFYEIEATENTWSIREMKRQIKVSLYERLALSRDEKKMRELGLKGQLISQPSDILKSPYVLEFLGLEEQPAYSEHELETAIIDKIEHFLLELGKGFLFEARQKRFTFDDDHFYVDLVFYNRLLRCYVIIDLKRDKLSHQDLGQMQMYVNYFDRYVKLEDEKPTVGILLCHTKQDDLVELTLPKKSNIYATEYKLYLPSKEEFKKQLEEARAEWDAITVDSSAVRKADKPNKKKGEGE